MKRTVAYLFAGTLAVTIGLSACGRSTGDRFTGQALAWIGSPDRNGPLSTGATIVVRAAIADQARHTMSEAPFRRADIVHLTIDLYNAQTNAIVASIDLQNDQLDSSVTFGSLAAQTSYRIVPTAYGVDSLGNPIVVNEVALSTTNIDVLNDSQVDVTVSVRLTGADFSGSGTSNVVIVDGTYSSPASPTISIVGSEPPATPTPAPGSNLSWADGYSLATYVSLDSISGALPTNFPTTWYDFRLERIFEGTPDFQYMIRWGANAGGGLSYQYLGSAWPPPPTTIAGPEGSGAGTLAIHFQGPDPAENLGGIVLVN